MDREEGDEIWAEAREMGRIEYRRIGMGETKTVWQNGKIDREEGYELWAEARGMRRIEGWLIGMGRQKKYVKTELEMCPSEHEWPASQKSVKPPK